MLLKKKFVRLPNKMEVQYRHRVEIISFGSSPLFSYPKVTQVRLMKPNRIAVNREFGIILILVDQLLIDFNNMKAL